MNNAFEFLQNLGVKIKRSKRGNVLVVDFRPIAQQVRDEHLEKMSEFAALREVYLDGTGVTDDGIQHLLELQKLATIDLQNSAVTDTGIEQLKGLPALKLLLLNGSSVTVEGVKVLRKSMLNTRIVFFN